MTAEQVPADEHHGERLRVLRQVYDREHPTAQWQRAHAEELFRIITDLRASLSREENGRKVLADANTRLTGERQQWQDRAERICNLVLRLNADEGLSADALAGLQRLATAALGKKS